MHSTTKSISGHSDATGGALLLPTAATCVPDDYTVASSQDDPPRTLYQALRDQRTALGAVPGSLETWLLLRSLRTLHLRVERQCDTATRLAVWLAGEAGAGPSSSSSLNDEEGAAFGGAAAGGEGVRGRAADKAAALVPLVLHPSLPGTRGYEVAKSQMALKGAVLAIHLTSEAAARELPRALRLFRDATSLGGVESKAEWRYQYDADVAPELVRLSVGLEQFEDLQDDLTQAILEVSRLS